jgi:hypothetical protein
MATRSKKSASDSNLDQSSTGKRTQWTTDDEAALVACLLKHKSEAGDGLNFKSSTWSQVAKEMDGRKTKGGEKTVDSCKTKWNRVRHTTMILVV